jgi:hypothetical protein
MFDELHNLFAQVSRQHDLQLMAQRALQAAAAEWQSEDFERYTQLVKRLSDRLGMPIDQVELRIELLALGVAA